MKIEFTDGEIKFIMNDLFTNYEKDYERKRLFNDYYYKKHTLFRFTGLTDKLKEQTGASEGFVRIILKSRASKKTYLNFIDRSPELSGHGIGTIILSRVLLILKEIGVKRLYIRPYIEKIPYYRDHFNAWPSYNNDSVWYIETANLENNLEIQALTR